MKAASPGTRQLESDMKADFGGSGTADSAFGLFIHTLTEGLGAVYRMKIYLLESLFHTIYRVV